MALNVITNGRSKTLKTFLTSTETSAGLMMLLRELITEVDERVADVERSAEAASFHLGHLLVVVRNIRLLGRLRTSALCLKHDVQTGTRREDGHVLANTSTVRVDLFSLVVRTVVDLDVVERTAAYTRTQCDHVSHKTNNRRSAYSRAS